MIKIILFGMSIHPGNLIYVLLMLGCFAAGLQNDNAPWWIGLIAWIFWIPLYVATSYSVGKANFDFKANAPESKEKLESEER